MIKQLSKRAIELVNQELTAPNPNVWIEAYNQKMAELIVEECFIKLIPYMDDQSIDDIKSELNEHFFKASDPETKQVR